MGGEGTRQGDHDIQQRVFKQWRIIIIFLTYFTGWICTPIYQFKISWERVIREHVR